VLLRSAPAITFWNFTVGWKQIAQNCSDEGMAIRTSTYKLI